MTSRHGFLSLVTLGLVLALAGTAAANGEEFFAAAKEGKIDLVYYGRIKDKRTGRSVADSVYFLLRDQATGLSFPFTNDKPGHYRSPDVGAAIKEIGETVDVDRFEIDVNVAGYKRLTVTRVPRKSHGTVGLDLSLEPLAPETMATAGVNGTNDPPYTKTLIFLIGSAVLFFIGRGLAHGIRRR